MPIIVAAAIAGTRIVGPGSVEWVGDSGSISVIPLVLMIEWPVLLPWSDCVSPAASKGPEPPSSLSDLSTKHEQIGDLFQNSVV